MRYRSQHSSRCPKVYRGNDALLNAETGELNSFHDAKHAIPNTRVRRIAAHREDNGWDM